MAKFDETKVINALHTDKAVVDEIVLHKDEILTIWIK